MLVLHNPEYHMPERDVRFMQFHVKVYSYEETDSMHCTFQNYREYSPAWPNFRSIVAIVNDTTVATSTERKVIKIPIQRAEFIR